MEERLHPGQSGFPFGYTALAEENGKHADMLMDFGILRLAATQEYTECRDQECAYLLVSGHVEMAWEEKTQIMERANCFDASPWVLHVPAGTSVTIRGIGPDSEIAIQRTKNEKPFPSRLYRPEDTPDENRGAGTMKETCTRLVRTVFDYSTAPYSNMVLGEVINYPGKWSSFPPHIHPQPEIYYYKMNPSIGYGFCEYGDDVIKVRNGDTVFIQADYTHPQVATPGYALWYLWVIRHLDGNPYRSPVYPYFLPEHDYLRNPETPIWPDTKK